MLYIATQKDGVLKKTTKKNTFLHEGKESWWMN